MNYKVTPLKLAIHTEQSNPVFGETTIHVELDDECWGPYIVLTDLGEGAKPGVVRIDLDELEIVLESAKKMIKEYPVK